MTPLKLYRHPLSGHSHRAELFISLLGLEAELIDIDLLAGEHKRPAFLQKNSLAQVPVLEDGDKIIADSNAILVYLASLYDKECRWLPTDPVTAAGVQRFLSISAGPIMQGPAIARVINVFGRKFNQVKAIESAHAILKLIEFHLEGRYWLVDDHLTIADIANYTYIAHAPEGGVSLESYSNIKSWLQRIERLPRFIAMKTTRVGLLER